MNSCKSLSKICQRPVEISVITCQKPSKPVNIVKICLTLPKSVKTCPNRSSLVNSCQNLFISCKNLIAFFRYHSEESLQASKSGNNGLCSSRIHSSADEISSINHSELSSSDESFSRTDFSRDEDGDSPSPPSRPRSHAPWIYPSDIQIDPSSLEVSPKLQHNEFPNGNTSDDDPLSNLRMPSVGPSPSIQDTSREPTEDKESEVSEEEEQDLRKRLNLPHGVTAAESCRSASPGDGLTDSYRGDSCGSFEFLTKSRRTR